VLPVSVPVKKFILEPEPVPVWKFGIGAALELDFGFCTMPASNCHGIEYENSFVCIIKVHTGPFFLHYGNAL